MLAQCGCGLVDVCVCVTMKKKVPDEWQARQATPAILQVSSSKHNAKKITTRVCVCVLCACVPCVCRVYARVCACACIHTHDDTQADVRGS